VRVAQPLAPVVLQAVQAFNTQKAFAGSFVQPVSVTHSTHFPETASHACAPQAVAPAPWHPTHTPATQNAFVGSVQSPFTPQVPAASGTKTSGKAASATRASTGRPASLACPTSTGVAASTGDPPPSTPTGESTAVSAATSAPPASPTGMTAASGDTHIAHATLQTKPPLQSLFLAQ
jgi:hypothetical protein